MDSGNSSSMQSSSGGDDQEYDSRSLFHHSMNMNPPPLPPPPPPPHHPNFLQPQLFHWPPAPLLRSDPDTNYLSFAAAGGHLAGTSAAPPPSAAAASIPSASSPAPPPRSQPPKIAGPSKNPKKRTRASRRAPTTVLTTDTSNFRAMVQEFTGIPDPPFSSSSGSAASRRLDLFSSAGSSMRLAAAAASLGGQPFRPAAQRLPSSSFLMNQDPLGALGSGQADAFQSLIQPPLLFPPPSNMNTSAFGINMGGLLVPSQNLSSGMDPPGVGVGFGSSSEPEHGGTNPNNDYVTSQGNAEYRSQ